MRRLRRLVRRTAGYSLVELVVVMVILGTILTALTTAFVQGSNAELDTNRRVQAQLQATAAFDRLRRDVHCASSASLNGTTLLLSGCGSGDVSWCTDTSGTGTGYSLYRLAGDACSSTTGKLYADYLTSGSLFTPVASSSTSLAKVHVDVIVNVAPAKAVDSFELVDDMVLRNSLRVD
jgi:prepilin-type N-terminal cleavage/methylation domain-containing protein